MLAFYGDPYLHCERFMDGELGLFENLTVFFLVLAILFAIRAYLLLKDVPLLFKKAVFVCFITGCIYYGGEEASWGQHWFGWGTPDYFLEVNYQDETNIHNTSDIFNHVPRELLIASILFISVFLPILSKWLDLKQSFLGKKFGWLYFEHQFMCLAAILLLTRTPDRLTKIFPSVGVIPFPVNSKEFQELFIALFLFLFAWGLLNKASAKAFEWDEKRRSVTAIVLCLTCFLPLFFISMRPMGMLFSGVIVSLFLFVHFLAKIINARTERLKD